MPRTAPAAGRPIVFLIGLLALAFPARAQFTPPSSDYFPMFLGSTWIYEATAGNLTTNLGVEIDALGSAPGRNSYGHTSQVLIAGPYFPDRTTEYRSAGPGGIYVDRTCIQQQFGYPVCANFNGLNIVGPTLEVGAIKLLGKPVNITLGDPVPVAQWNGNGSGSSTVLARETITVPAGSFDTFKIRFTFGYSAVLFPPGNPAYPPSITGWEDTTLWVAAGVGIVKQTSARSSDLITAFTSTRSLKSFELNGPRYTISGRVVDGGGSGIPGAEMQMMSGADLVGLATTAADGSYEFLNREAGAYSITPVLPDFSFTPETRDLFLVEEIAVPDFVGTFQSPDLTIRPYPLANGFGMAWDSEVGTTYKVFASANGSTWVDAGAAPFPGTGAELRYEKTWLPGERPPFQLYRLEATRD